MAIGLDTNVLARYFVAPGENAAERRQHEAAKRLIDSGRPLKVVKTVLLELEWMLRGFYDYRRDEIGKVLAWLVAQPHIEIEDRAAVRQALANHADGLDFSDALHHAGYADCESVVSFDDRGFARRSGKLGMQPPVKLPASIG